MKASDNVFPKLICAEGAAPATPSANTVVVYAKADGKMYSKDDAGTETALGVGGGGGTYTDEQAMDAVAAMFAAGTHVGITFSYNDAGNAISATVSGVSTPTLQSVTSTATFTPAATDDVCVISAQAAALTIAAPAGTSDGRRTIVFKIKATGAYGITWGAAYRWIGTPYTTTVAGKWAYITGIYNDDDDVMDLMTPQVQP